MAKVREMTQRKLTDNERRQAREARVHITNMCEWKDLADGHQYWHGVASRLLAMVEHATTDGKPYVDPQPPIPEGYRLATEADAKRNDRKFWDRYEKKWVTAVQMSYTADVVFIVPIEPPIPDGYRKAVAGDEGRRDVKFWSPLASEWQDRPNPERGFTSDDRYAVPIDRVPTDEEAKSRPEVMVRNERERWQRAVLVAVIPSAPYPFYVLDKECCPSCQYCRHLYPGE